METQNEIKYAGFWIRWVAFTIDCLIASILSAIIQVVLGILFGIIGINQLVNFLLLPLIGLLIFVGYFVFMTYKYQATLGKMAVGIKVFSNGELGLTMGQIILRETIGRLLSAIIFFVGYLMAGFTDKKQALHDKIANTVVIYKDPNKKIPKWPIVVAILIIVVPLFLGILLGTILGIIDQSKVKRRTIKDMDPISTIKLKNDSIDSDALTKEQADFWASQKDVKMSPKDIVLPNGKTNFEFICLNDYDFFKKWTIDENLIKECDLLRKDKALN